MTRARKRVPVGRRLARLGRPVLAAGLLAALAWAAVQGFHRSADATDTGRLADRLEVTRAAAASVGGWLDAGMKEAAAVSAQAAQVGPQQAAGDYAAHPHAFREALVLNRSLGWAGGTQRYTNSTGPVLACRDAKGAALDNGLHDLA